MSNYDPDTLIHLDGLAELAQRASAAHAASVEQDLDYERFGVCTPDLIAVARGYGVEVVQRSNSLTSMLVTQFLAGFDLGYQARLELEMREKTAEEIVPGGEGS